MHNPIKFGPSLFLVSVGDVTARQIADPRCNGYPLSGILLEQPTARGPVELFIATDADLSAWANLAALSILKPIVLPLTLAEVHAGRINAHLRADPQAHKLATHILHALPNLTNPAQPAGVSRRNSTKGY